MLPLTLSLAAASASLLADLGHSWLHRWGEVGGEWLGRSKPETIVLLWPRVAAQLEAAICCVCLRCVA